ncbi:MAG: hypothetical protein AB1400_05650 [Pseudomonadota bacterium]
MIDLNGNTIYNASELKARSMSRLNQQGLGYPELIAMLCRAVFSLRGDYRLNTETEAQIKGIGELLTVEESEYRQEITDNELLTEVLRYEESTLRLAQPVLVVSDEIIKEVVDADNAIRASHQAVVDAASERVINLAKFREPKEV